MIDSIAEALQNSNLEAENVDGTLNVTRGRGPMARRVNIDPTTFIQWASERDDDGRDVAAYARGVYAVLLEPKRSDARSWTFVESAGSVYPTIEVEAYRHGVRDASGGEDAWFQELADDLIVAWMMRLDRGMRPVTQAQFEDWGVTVDRVTSAGRSLLFHSTRNTDWKAGDWREPVRALRVGDGFDAARLFVAEDVFFTEVDSGWRFAFPDPDLLLAVNAPEHTDILAEETRRCFERADEPLSDRVWRLEKGLPVADD